MRIVALDVVRGVAVMGILLLNIVSFALPSAAYSDPTAYGDGGKADWWTWAMTFVLFDGKMRGLFTLLFGASTLLIVDRARAAGQSEIRVHYARMAALLAIGMAHAWLIWSGDILVLYALCGALVFLARRWRPRLLVAVAAGLLACHLALGITAWQAAVRFEAAARAPGASADVSAEWTAWQRALAHDPADDAREVAAYRGDWAAVMRERAAQTAEQQQVALPVFGPATIAAMLIGMALFRIGYFDRWSARRHRLVAIGALAVGLPAEVAVVALIDASGFNPETRSVGDAIHLALLAPLLTLAYASATIAWVKTGALPRLIAGIAAVGRAALSNYLGTSIVCTSLFYGYGLALFGHVDRWALYPIVAAIWLLMLAWSTPWLRRHRQGPAEWIWRRMTFSS